MREQKQVVIVTLQMSNKRLCKPDQDYFITYWINLRAVRRINWKIVLCCIHGRLFLTYRHQALKKWTGQYLLARTWLVRYCLLAVMLVVGYVKQWLMLKIVFSANIKSSPLKCFKGFINWSGVMSVSASTDLILIQICCQDCRSADRLCGFTALLTHKSQVSPAKEDMLDCLSVCLVLSSHDLFISYPVLSSVLFPTFVRNVRRRSRGLENVRW